MIMSTEAPLTPEYLFEALQAASSQSQDLVQNASAQLKSWERQSGYWSMLQVGTLVGAKSSLFILANKNRTCSSTAPSPSKSAGSL